MKIWVGKNKKLTKKKEKNEKKNPTKRCSSKNFFIFPEEKKNEPAQFKNCFRRAYSGGKNTVKKKNTGKVHFFSFSARGAKKQQPQ